MEKKYYTEQTITFIVEHGLENIIREALESNERVEIVDGENGSKIIILQKNETQKTK